MIVNKNDVILGDDLLGKNSITWGQAKSTGMPPDKKVNKAEELAHLSIDIGRNQSLPK